MKVVPLPRFITNDNLWLNSKFHSCVDSLQNPFKSVTNTNYNSHLHLVHVGCWLVTSHLNVLDTRFQLVTFSLSLKRRSCEPIISQLLVIRAGRSCCLTPQHRLSFLVDTDNLLPCNFLQPPPLTHVPRRWRFRDVWQNEAVPPLSATTRPSSPASSAAAWCSASPRPLLWRSELHSGLSRGCEPSTQPRSRSTSFLNHVYFMKMTARGTL